jgi:N-acetylglucosamine-6-phosphate deacetylase
MLLGVAAALVDGSIIPGDVEISDGVVAAVGRSPAGKRGLAAPGFVDLQVNGYAGIDVRDATPDDYAIMSATLARDGVTAWLPTVPSSDAAATRATLDTASRAIGEGHGSIGARPLGVHLEGPFLSPRRRGAHPAKDLRPIDPPYLRELCELAPVRLVTLAPELPGALEVIRSLAASAIAVSVGHSDATAAEAHAAFDAGASAHTHVWNAHRPMASRDPGPAAVALHRSDVTPCFIGDLAHVHADALLVGVNAAPDRYLLVTDANAVTSAADGLRSPRAAAIEVADGAARLPDGSLCGGSLPLHGAVRNLVSLGRPLQEVLAAVTSRPARLIGEGSLGQIHPAAVADIVVLDDDLQPVATFVAGRPVS